MWEGLKNLLSGTKDWAQNAEVSTGLATMLGEFGSAVSQEGSWQDRLGASAAELGREEQSRKYLADILAGKPGDQQGQEPKGQQASGKKSESDSGESDLSRDQADALRDPGLGSILSEYFTNRLPSSSDLSARRRR